MPNSVLRKKNFCILLYTLPKTLKGQLLNKFSKLQGQPILLKKAKFGFLASKRPNLATLVCPLPHPSLLYTPAAGDDGCLVLNSLRYCQGRIKKLTQRRANETNLLLSTHLQTSNGSSDIVTQGTYADML